MTWTSAGDYGSNAGSGWLWPPPSKAFRRRRAIRLARRIRRAKHGWR